MCIRDRPIPPVTEEELAYGKEISKALPNGRPEQPYMDTLMPYEPETQGFSSTDVGDVSWLTPTAQFNAVTWVSGSPGHSWQNVATGKTSIAHKGLLFAAKVLAAATADKLTFLAVCGKDAVAKGVRAGDLVKQVCTCCGGSGGGKPDSAMGGGKDVNKVDDALALVDDFVSSKLN